MSDGLRRLAGTPLPATINGKTYTLEPVTLAMLAEIESHLVGVRPNVLIETLKVLGQVPEAMRERALQLAMEQAKKAGASSGEEMSGYMGSLTGLSHLFWLMARKNHPEVATLAAAVGIIGAVPLAEVKAVVDFASGMIDLGNFGGPTAAADRAAA